MTNTNLTMVIAVLVAGLALPAFKLAAGQPVSVDLTGETVGAEPTSLIPVVGIWRIENDGGRKVLTVDVPATLRKAKEYRDRVLASLK